jgi:hypothetical protein
MPPWPARLGRCPRAAGLANADPRACPPSSQAGTWRATPSPGEDRPNSDVGLLADFPSGLSLFGLSRLKAILGTRADLIPAANLKPGVREQVEADLITLCVTGTASGWPTSRLPSMRSAPNCNAAT